MCRACRSSLRPMSAPSARAPGGLLTSTGNAPPANMLGRAFRDVGEEAAGEGRALRLHTSGRAEAVLSVDSFLASEATGCDGARLVSARDFALA
mmetsp:Transcript_109717/g.310381  ORF Transcript_109717/g.310381 Transcript_109717/m.310381 type:complete len:94 (+) Transcript_109717:756-1037(+)